MSNWDKIKTMATSNIPTFKSPEANELRRWIIASSVVEMALAMVFGLWSAFNGGGYWGSRAVVWVVGSIIFITVVGGVVRCNKIDKMPENANKMGQYKLTLILLVLITFLVAALLAVKLSE